MKDPDTNTRDCIAKTINNGLMSQDFVDWYEHDYQAFVNCDYGAKSKEEILEDIKQIFDL